MVDLRTRKQELPDEPQDLLPDDHITAPSPDLMQRLHERFAIYIPDRAHSAVVAEEVAEQRGAWLVINFLQSIIDSQENHP
jgi:hypothetical protein